MFVHVLAGVALPRVSVTLAGLRCPRSSLAAAAVLIAHAVVTGIQIGQILNPATFIMSEGKYYCHNFLQSSLVKREALTIVLRGATPLFTIPQLG